MRYFSATDILNERHISRKTASTLTPTTNAITVTVAGVAGKVHRLGRIVLLGTAGTGAAESIIIVDGITTVWPETFVVGTEKIISFGQMPLEMTEGNTLTVTVSATNLTAGKLYVQYETVG